MSKPYPQWIQRARAGIAAVLPSWALTRQLDLLHQLINTRLLLAGLGLVLIGLLGLVMTAVNQSEQLDIRLHTQPLHSLSEREAEHLNHSLDQARRSVARLKNYVGLFAEHSPVNTADLALVERLMRAELGQQHEQLSNYFAYERNPAKTYFDKNAMLGVVYKDAARQAEADYDDPARLKFKVWQDSNYLNNEREHWYHINKQSEKVHVTPLYYDKNYMRQWVFSVTQGLYEHRQFQGMVGINLLADSFFGPVEQQRIGESGGLLLVDYSSGALLTQTQAPDQAEETPAAALMGKYGRMQHNLYNGEQKAIWQKALTQDSQGVLVQGNNQETYLLHTQVLDAVPWTLVVYQRVDEVSQASSQLSSRLLSVVLVGLGLLLLGWCYLQTLRPLRQILSVIEQANQDTDDTLWQVPVSGSPETRRLGMALNRFFAEHLYSNRNARDEQLQCQQRLQSYEAQLQEKNQQLLAHGTQLQQHNQQLNQARRVVQAAKQRLRMAAATIQKLKMYARKAQLTVEQSKLEVDIANQTKTRFLANMSHELRTPMNAIIGYTEILQEDAQELGYDEFIPDLQKIHGASYHMLDLINNLFDLSKIESSQMELYLETFDVVPMLQDVVVTVQPLVEKQDNLLKLQLDNALGTMTADLTKVRQSLMNLLGNAGKFTKQGLVTLAVSRERLGGRDWIIFKVSDEGIGMSPEQLRKLRETFVSLEGNLQDYAGNSLGLAVTMQFCRLMGGELSIDSKPNEGSHFSIRLPTDVTPLHLGGERLSNF